MYNYKNCYISSITNSSGQIQLNAGFDIVEDTDTTIKHEMTIAGQINSFKITGKNYKYTIPVFKIDAQDKADIELFWSRRDTVRLEFNIENSWGIEGKIINNENPFQQFFTMSTSYWTGFLRIAQTTGQNRQNFIFFTLDSPTKGILDQNVLG